MDIDRGIPGGVESNHLARSQLQVVRNGCARIGIINGVGSRVRHAAAQIHDGETRCQIVVARNHQAQEGVIDWRKCCRCTRGYWRIGVSRLRSIGIGGALRLRLRRVRIRRLRRISIGGSLRRVRIRRRRRGWVRRRLGGCIGGRWYVRVYSGWLRGRVGVGRSRRGRVGRRWCVCFHSLSQRKSVCHSRCHV